MKRNSKNTEEEEERFTEKKNTINNTGDNQEHNKVLNNKAKRPLLKSKHCQLISITTMLEQEEGNSTPSDLDKKKQDQTTCCFKRGGKWIVALSMIVSFTIVAILAAILTIKLLDTENDCFNSIPLEQSDYKLFSTKTTYSSAFKEFNNIVKSFPDSPKIFSTESLALLNQDLTIRDKCKVRQFHYFGRHASRFPNKKEIERINKFIVGVRDRLDSSQFIVPRSSSETNLNGTTTTCLNPLDQYKQWSPYNPDLDDLVMESGLRETDAIALRYAALLPEMFNNLSTKITLGTTQKLRTAQTAISFLKQLKNFDTKCKLEDYPTLDDFRDDAKIKAIIDDKCFKNFLENAHDEKLEFHKKCKESYKENRITNSGLNISSRAGFIQESVSKRLKFTGKDELSLQEVEAIYDVCKYETALGGSSIWCNLFSESELKFFEYLNDLDDYFNNAYGHQNFAKSACKVTKPLRSDFKSAVQSEGNQTNLYFTHSEVIQRIIAASINLEDYYKSEDVLSHLKAGTVPENQLWRTSLYTPFSANLAFILYHCPNQDKTDKFSMGGQLVFDTNKGYKVVAALNEHPIVLSGCDDKVVCDLSDLEEYGRLFQEKTCDYKSICRLNPIFT